MTFANDPILLNGSLVRTKGTESYLVGAVLFIVGSLPAINPLAFTGTCFPECKCSVDDDDITHAA